MHTYTYFVCLPFWKLKGSIYLFGSFYKKVNTTLQEVSLYKKVGKSKMKNSLSKMRDPTVSQEC